MAGGVGRLTVVLVDDHDAGRRAIARQLAACGLRVVEFGAAVAALYHLAQHGADLLITDLEMPGMDGAALIAAVQRRGLARRLIVISGQGADHCSACLAALGVAPMAEIVQKPISLETLRRLVAG